MSEERSLDLDLDEAGSGTDARPVARVAVIGTWGVTRDGAGSTVTPDCASTAALEREIDRLHGELDDVLARGSAVLGEAAARSAVEQRERRKAARAREAAPPKPRLSVGWRVGDVMTRDVRTVGQNASAAAAKALMDSGRIRHVVVVDADGAVDGVLSHRDLFFGPLAWSIGQGKGAYEKLLDSSRVKDVMQSDVVTIGATAAIQDAAALMRERGIGCLPVVEGERLVGLITEGDFVQLVSEADPPPG